MLSFVEEYLEASATEHIRSVPSRYTTIADSFENSSLFSLVRLFSSVSPSFVFQISTQIKFV